MECTLPQIVDVVASFVARTRDLPGDTVQPATRLLQEGLLDSFSLVELIADLESALGASLPEGALLPEDFESPQVLCDRLRQL